MFPREYLWLIIVVPLTVVLKKVFEKLEVDTQDTDEEVTNSKEQSKNKK